MFYTDLFRYYRLERDFFCHQNRDSVRCIIVATNIFFFISLVIISICSKKVDRIGVVSVVQGQEDSLDQIAQGYTIKKTAPGCCIPVPRL
jgi:hypothetical protein